MDSGQAAKLMTQVPEGAWLALSPASALILSWAHCP